MAVSPPERDVADPDTAAVAATVAPAVWHTFPSPGGMTGFVILAESHLACHTFPEFGSICVNVFCCRARADFDAAALMAETLGATDTYARRVDRTYGPAGPGPA